MSTQFHTPPLGQARQREMMKAATSLEYAESPEGPLSAHFFTPDNFTPENQYPAIIFFHGGFWDHSMPTQFVPQCLHFASRGAIAISVETRVETVHQSGPLEALEDSRTFLGWLAENAEKFHLDLTQCVLGGAAGGAWLALQNTLPKTRKKDPQPPITPAANILFSALLDTLKPSILKKFRDHHIAKSLSPLKQVRRKLPPIYLCHGMSDRVTPFSDVRKFAKALRWRGNRAELIDYEKAEHSFFNFNVSEFYYELSVKSADHFLVDLGILQPDEFADLPLNQESSQ